MLAMARLGARMRLVAAIVVIVVAGCAPAAVPSPAGVAPASSGALPSAPGALPSAPAGQTGTMVLTGRIVTMGEPAVAEAMFIEDGVVAAIGTRADVLAAAGDSVPVLDLGPNVAYPGFVDAHAHWIGDRNYYHLDTPAAALEAAGSRGWTSISEQWVNPERLEELEGLAAAGSLPLRVDAYLALNYDREFFGDWYEGREPGAVDDHLRVRGLKIHLDDGWGNVVNWEPADVTGAIGRADDAGWQVSVHAMNSVAVEMVLDAFEAAIGATGPNPLHHRIEHAVQVTDDQLGRMVAMDIAVVTHLDGVGDWVDDDEFLTAFERGAPGAADEITRWRDFVDAGLHVASATDAPWTFPELTLADDLGRPVDQVAAGMDGRVRTTGETPPWLADQLLTAEQALRTVTLDAAYAVGDESRRGHLAPGTFGDVTIVSGDILAATTDEIRAMDIVATIVGGVVVHCADTSVC